MNDADPIRVLLADDHPVVREGVAAMLNRRPDMEVVAEADNGRAAIELFRTYRPDVVLMDLRMPELGGVAAIEAITAEFPDARIIVLTTYDGDEDIFRGLEAGAKAYLLKDTPRNDLLDTIRAVAQGQRRIPPALAAKLSQRLFTEPLTSRELDVLRQLAAGKSNSDIGDALAITEGTVKVHVNNILGKLQAESRTQAVTEALKRGIIHLDDT